MFGENKCEWYVVDIVRIARLPLSFFFACSFRWIIVAESTIRWFIVREKHCWMAADLAE
jgi:hypothetical protein